MYIRYTVFSSLNIMEADKVCRKQNTRRYQQRIEQIMSRARNIMLVKSSVNSSPRTSVRSETNSSVENVSFLNQSTESPGYIEIDANILKSNESKPFDDGLTERSEGIIAENDLDDSICDPDYQFNTEDERSELDSIDSSLNSGIKESNDKSNKLNLENKNSSSIILMKNSSNEIQNLDFDKAEISHKQLSVENSLKSTKKHFCFYCKTLQTKFARHLKNKHIHEKNVAAFLKFPKKSKERQQLIAAIRKKGDASYNRKIDYNLGDLIVVRRPHFTKRRVAEHYMPCSNCDGMYSILSLKNHFSKCKENREKLTKDVLSSSRARCYINSKANIIMATQILPPMRNDEVNTLVRSEDLIILFGNRMTHKYRSPHLFKMIRSRLRCVAKFYLNFKKREPHITQFEEVFNPQNYDNAILSINEVSGLNEKTGKYRAPSTAASICSYLKKISLYLICEMIKRKDKVRLEEIRDFLQLLNEGLSYDIYKTVTENQLEIKRNKVIKLPTSNDISLLGDYLNKTIKYHFKNLMKEFSFKSWVELSGALLIAVQLFNRRRAGEMERIKVDDFMQYESASSEQEADHGKKPKYVRFLIRGKRARGVPVLIDYFKLKCIKLILKLRGKARVPKKNPYVFGIPGKDDDRHFDSTRLLFHYSLACGAKDPKTLRGTELRKHFATECGTMDLEDLNIRDIADYMGHHENIHLEHYRMRNSTRDITRMSKLLEKAQGIEISSDFEENVEYSISPSTSTACGDKTRDSTISEDVKDTASTPQKKRVSWSMDERNVIENNVSFYLNNFESPTAECCVSLIKNNPILRNRTPTSVKAFILNEIKKRKQSILNPCVKKVGRGVKKFWTVEEKKEVFNIFNEDINSKRTPRLYACRKAIEENEVLRDRTPAMLKAFVNNILKKKKCVL